MASETADELTVYRAGFAGHDIPLGLYTNQAAARAHCEAQLSIEYPPNVAILHDWIGDDSGPLEPWQLVVEVDGAPQQPTGYMVTPLTVASAYDEDGEE